MSLEVKEKSAGIILFKKGYLSEVKRSCPGVNIVYDLNSRTITFTGSNSVSVPQAARLLDSLSSRMVSLRLNSDKLAAIPNYKDLLYKNKNQVTGRITQNRIHASFDLGSDDIIIYGEDINTADLVKQYMEEVVSKEHFLTNPDPNSNTKGLSTGLANSSSMQQQLPQQPSDSHDQSQSPPPPYSEVQPFSQPMNMGNNNVIQPNSHPVGPFSPRNQNPQEMNRHQQHSSAYLGGYGPGYEHPPSEGLRMPNHTRQPGSNRLRGPYGQPGPNRQPGPHRQPGPYGQPGPNRQPGPYRQPGPNRQPGPHIQPSPTRQAFIGQPGPNRQSSTNIRKSDMHTLPGIFVYLQRAGLLKEIAKMLGNKEPELVKGADKKYFVRFNEKSDLKSVNDARSKLQNELANVYEYVHKLEHGGITRLLKYSKDLKSDIYQSFKQNSITATWWTEDDDETVITYADSKQNAQRASEVMISCIMKKPLEVDSAEEDIIKSLVPRINQNDEFQISITNGIKLIGRESTCTTVVNALREWLITKSDGRPWMNVEALVNAPGELKFARLYLKSKVGKLASDVSDGLNIQWKSALQVSGKPDDVLLFQLSLIPFVKSRNLSFKPLEVKYFSENMNKLTAIGTKNKVVLTASYTNDSPSHLNPPVQSEPTVTQTTNQLPSSANSIQSSGNFNMNGMSVAMITGDICDAKADCIIKSAGGQVSQAIEKKAGRTLSDSPATRQKDGFSIIGGLGLWKEIISFKISSKTLTDTVYNALTTAEDGGHQQVAMPTVGTGGYGAGSDEAARLVCEGIKKFTSSRPRVQLQKLMIIVRPQDVANFQAYTDMLTKLSNHNLTNSTTNLSDMSTGAQLSDPSCQGETAPRSDNKTTSLKVYYDDAIGIGNVVKDLREVISDQFKTIVWSSENEDEKDLVTQLQQLDIKDLQRKAEERSVDLSLKEKGEMVTGKLFGTKENVNSMEMDIRMLLHERKTRIFPDSWDSQTGNYLAVTLNPVSPEYKIVEQRFTSSIQRSATIVKIERIQNRNQYTQFISERNRVAEQLKLDPNRVAHRFLWHGTAFENVEKICQGRFNRSLNGTNGVAYGQGTYFHISASYSHNYSRPDALGLRKMMAACIVVGDYVVGNSSMKAAPYTPGSQIDQYNTTVDNQASPSIFVVYTDPGAYPEYVISYKD